jgi:type VI secretion system protein VasD
LNKRIFLQGMMAGCALLALGGCSGIKIFGDKPPKVVIHITSSKDINPDISGRPSPLVLRIYALMNDDIFNTADFFALYGNDKSILGDTMTAREEVEIAPGDSIQMEKEFSMDTTHVGVIAAYRDLDNATWRGSIATPKNKTTPIEISVGRLTLSVTPGK